jgi:hypothetical protein
MARLNIYLCFEVVVGLASSKHFRRNAGGKVATGKVSVQKAIPWSSRFGVGPVANDTTS